MEWSDPPEVDLVDEYFEHVASPSAAVRERVTRVDRHAVDEPLHVSQLAVDREELVLVRVVAPELDGVVVSGYEFVGVPVEALQVLAALVRLVRRRLQALALALRDAPQNHQVAVGLAAQRHQVLVVARERQRLHALFVEFHAVQHFLRLEIPHDQGRLESLVLDLFTRRQELAGLGRRQNADLAFVALEIDGSGITLRKVDCKSNRLLITRVQPRE